MLRIRNDLIPTLNKTLLTSIFFLLCFIFSWPSPTTFHLSMLVGNGNGNSARKETTKIHFGERKIQIYLTYFKGLNKAKCQPAECCLVKLLGQAVVTCILNDTRFFCRFTLLIINTGNKRLYATPRDHRLQNLRFANDGMVVLGEVARVLGSNDLDHFLNRKDMMFMTLDFCNFSVYIFSVMLLCIKAIETIIKEY